MKIETIMENILDRLAQKSVTAKTHEERINKDKIAYSFIREFLDEDKIKYWNDYYSSAKRSLS